MTVFELDGQEFVALNGGSRFKFTAALSSMLGLTLEFLNKDA